MRTPRAPRLHIRQLVRVSVVALLAGLLHVATVAPASATVPHGVVDAFSSPAPGRIYTGGWAFDPDESSRFVAIHVYVGGHGVNLGEAKLYRPDVNQVYGTGDHHGFDAAFDVPVVGDLPYEVYGIDTQGGPPALLASGRVNVADPTITGAVESAESQSHRTVQLKGWASDSDTPTAPVAIEAYIGGTFHTPGVEHRPLTANVTRSDGRLGFTGQFTTTKTGVQDIYVYAKNVPGTPGADRLIAVSQVTVYVDTTPPQTTITSAPETATPTDVIRVEFSATEPNATFECRWDAGGWSACVGSTTVSLTPGNHMVAVRASDVYGNTDQSPATWMVAVSANPTTPVDPNARTIGARAVKKKSKLRIDVGPDSAKSNYRVVVQRKVGKKWRRVVRVRTRGGRDVALVNLRRGKYRVVLPKSAHGAALTSDAVRLKR